MQAMQEDDCGASTFHQRDDVTLLIRNFNYPMPNAIQKRKSQTRSTTDSSTELSGSTFFNLTHNNNTNSSSNSTTSGRLDSDKDIHKNLKIQPYVDFSDYFNNVKEARKNGTLPSGIEFD
jgi:TAK1-binding protein 1